jgi:hypothetical protein
LQEDERDARDHFITDIPVRALFLFSGKKCSMVAKFCEAVGTGSLEVDAENETEGQLGNERHTI